MANKVKEWFSVRTNADGSKSEGLGDWDISRDAPYFGIEIPDLPDGAPSKYFYVWLDAPVGYLASLKNLLEKRGEDFDAYMAQPELEQHHSQRKKEKKEEKKLTFKISLYSASSPLCFSAFKKKPLHLKILNISASSLLCLSAFKKNLCI